MKRLAFFLVLALVPYLSQAVTIKGKILDSKGEPTPAAIAQFSDHETERIVDAESDGSFSIDIGNAYSKKVMFAAANCDNFEQTFLIDPENPKDLEIEVLLAPLPRPSDLAGFAIRGDFNDFSFDEGLIEMTENSDRTWSATIKNPGDTLVYQIVSLHETAPARSFNGPKYDFLEYDGGGDFFSYIITGGEDQEIVFDPSILNADGYVNTNVIKTKIVSDDAEFNEYFEKAGLADDLLYDYYRARSRIMMGDDVENPREKWIQKKSDYLDSLDAFIKNTDSRALRYYAMKKYFRVARDGQTMDGVEDKVKKEYALALKKAAPAVSDFWGRITATQTAIIQTLGEYPESDYLREIYETHPESEVRAWLLLDIVENQCRVGDTASATNYYEILKERMPKSKQAMYARLELGVGIKIEPGAHVPDFKVEDFDKKGVFITPETFAGKYVLYDVWATTCGPCIKEMKHLHSAYEKFKGKNFEIFSLSIDPNASVVDRFRTRYEMPWRNALLPQGFDSEIAKNFEVRGVPKTFLVDPDGVIVTVDKLRGDDLEKTLSELLE